MGIISRINIRNELTGDRSRISVYTSGYLENDTIIGIAETVLTEQISGKEFPQRYLFTKDDEDYKGFNIDFMIIVRKSISELREELIGENIRDVLSNISDALFESTIATIDIHDQAYNDLNKNIVEYSSDELWVAYAKTRLKFGNVELARLLNHQEKPEFIQWKKEFNKTIDTIDAPGIPHLIFKANDINFITLPEDPRQRHDQEISRSAPWPALEIDRPGPGQGSKK